MSKNSPSRILTPPPPPIIDWNDVVGRFSTDSISEKNKNSQPIRLADNVHHNSIKNSLSSDTADEYDISIDRQHRSICSIQQEKASEGFWRPEADESNFNNHKIGILEQMERFRNSDSAFRNKVQSDFEQSPGSCRTTMDFDVNENSSNESNHQHFQEMRFSSNTNNPEFKSNSGFGSLETTNNCSRKNENLNNKGWKSFASGGIRENNISMDTFVNHTKEPKRSRADDMDFEVPVKSFLDSNTVEGNNFDDGRVEVRIVNNAKIEYVSMTINQYERYKKGLSLGFPNYEALDLRKIGLVPANLTQNPLTLPQIQQIKSTIINYAAKWSLNTNLISCYPQNGWLIMLCNTEIVDMLQSHLTVIRNICRLDINLAIEGERLFPPGHIVHGYFPRSINYSSVKVMELIQAQNDITTILWRSVRQKVEEGLVLNVTFEIDDTSWRKLQELNGLIFYRFGQITLALEESGSNENKISELSNTSTTPYTSNSKEKYNLHDKPATAQSIQNATLMKLDQLKKDIATNMKLLEHKRTLERNQFYQLSCVTTATSNPSKFSEPTVYKKPRTALVNPQNIQNAKLTKLKQLKKNIATNMKLLECNRNANLEVVSQSSLPRRHTVSVRIPPPVLPTYKIIKLLEKQNDGFNTHFWELVSYEHVDKSSGMDLNFAIDTESLEKLKDYEVVYIGTTSSQSLKKVDNQPDDVVYIGTTEPQPSKHPDDVIYVGTSTPKLSQKRKAYDHLPSNTGAKKSRFDDNYPQRSDDLAQSSNYKKRKKPGDSDDGHIKPLLPPTPLPPPPSFDSFMSQLTIPTPIPLRNVHLENSNPKRYKSSFMEFNENKCNENSAKQQPPSRFDKSTSKISQYESKSNAESPSLDKDFKKQAERLENLTDISGSYNNSRFNKYSESYQHLPCSRNDLPERIASNKCDITAQLQNSPVDNYKVPRKTRFSECIESHKSDNSRNSENISKNSLQLRIGSDAPIQQFVGNVMNRSDSSNKFAGNAGLNRYTGKFNQYGSHSSGGSGPYSLSENNEAVAKSDSGNSAFANNIYNKDAGNSIKGSNNGTCGNTSKIVYDKDTFIHKENNQHLSSCNRFSRNTESSGNSYNQNIDSNFRNSFSKNVSRFSNRFENNRNNDNVGNTGNFKNRYNINNDRQSEKSATNLNQFNENISSTNTTENKSNLGNTGFKSDSGNKACHVSKFVGNKLDIGTIGSQQFKNKESFFVSGLQENARNFKIFNSSSNTTFPRNISQFLENASLKSSNSINQTNTYNYNTSTGFKPKDGYTKTFSQFDRNTSIGNSSAETNRQGEYQSNIGTLGNKQTHLNNTIENCSQLNKVTSYQNNTQQMGNKGYSDDSKFQENTRGNSNTNDCRDSNENNTLQKLPFRDGEMKSLEYLHDPRKNTLQYSVFSNNNNMQVEDRYSSRNSSQPGCNSGFVNSIHSKIENTDSNRDPKNIQFGMKRRTTSIGTNYQHNNAIDKLFSNKAFSHHEKLGCNSNGYYSEGKFGQNQNFYNINPAPPVPDLTKPPPPLPQIVNSAANTSANSPYTNSKNFQNRQQNTDQRFGNKNHFGDNNVGPRQTRRFGRNINGQNGNNSSDTRPTRPYGGNFKVPRPTRQFAGNNGSGMRKGPGKFVNQNANRTNINRFKPNTNRNSIHNSTKNNRIKQPTRITWKNKHRANQHDKFAKLLKLVKSRYAKKPRDPAKKEKQRKLKKLKKSKPTPGDGTNPKSEVEHIDVNKQVFGDFVPIKVGLKKPAKGHLKPKPEIYWKEWWSLYGYVENCLMPIDSNDADIKSALNFLLLPNDVEFRKRKRILLVMGVAKILRHIKLNESDYALRDIFSVLKYKHQLEDPHFQQNLNTKEKERVEKVLKHARKKTRRALFYQNMICRWHFSALLLKRANTGESFLKCGHAQKLMNDKAFNYLVWESIQELKKLISEDWPEFDQFYKSL